MGGFVRNPESIRRKTRLIKSFDVPFTDHAGNPAYMVWRNREDHPLPPLYSFAVYLTHPEISIEDFNRSAFLKSVVPDGTFSSGCPARLDLYSLPGATEADCIDHYRKEKAFRGNYMRQIEVLESTSVDQQLLPQLPGLVPNYHKNSTVLYQNYLLMCRDKTWDHEERWLLQVEFDPISQEDYDYFRSGSDRPTLPAFGVQKMPVSDQADWQGDREPVAWWMQSISAGVMEWTVLDPWHKATERGWQAWRG